MKKILGLGFIGLVILVGIGGFYFWFTGYQMKLADENSKSPEIVVATSTTNNQQLTTNDKKAEEKPIDQVIAKLPKYTGQAVSVIGNDPIIATLPASAVEAKKALLADLAVSLSKAPDNFNDWMSVGNYKKFFNDYWGVRDAWEYAKIINKNQPLVYLNLANLYAYYLNDQVRAEINYLAAVDLDISNSYGSLYAIANYYRDFDAKAKAIEYYQKVLKIDPNNQPIKIEISRLETLAD